MNIKKVFYGIVGCGGFISAVFWLPLTVSIIRKYGVWTAIETTHLLRIVLDLAVVVVCIQAMNQLYRLEKFEKNDNSMQRHASMNKADVVSRNWGLRNPWLFGICMFMGILILGCIVMIGQHLTNNNYALRILNIVIGACGVALSGIPFIPGFLYAKINQIELPISGAIKVMSVVFYAVVFIHHASSSVVRNDISFLFGYYILAAIPVILVQSWCFSKGSALYINYYKKSHSPVTAETGFEMFDGSDNR